MRGKVRMMRKPGLAAAMAAAGVFVSHGGTTNETEIAELPPVIVEASRTGRTADEMPEPVRVIGREEIAASGAKDVVELVERKAPSLNVIRTGAGNPALSQIAMRGWGENGFGRVLVMVDGRRLNYADMSAPLLSQIDLASVERIEILHGSQCVLHGDAASAGAINVVTMPSASDGDGVHGSVGVHAGSWDTYGANASVRGADAEAGVRWWGAGAWEHSDGFRGNNGWQTWNALGGVRRDWENGSYARFDAYWNESEYGLPGYLPAGSWKHHRTRTIAPDDIYRRQTAGVDATGEFVVNESNRIKIDASFSAGLMRTRSVYGGSYTDYDPSNGYAPAKVTYSDAFRQRYDLNAYEVTPQWICTEGLFGLDSEFVAGVSFRYDRLHGRNRDRMEYSPDFWRMSGLTSDKYEFNRMTAAAFAQETLDLNEWLAVEGGVRVQRAWSENTALVDKRRTDNMYAADIAALVRPADGFKGFARLSRYFRSPFLDENPYRDFRAQEILKPETGWIADVGFDWLVATDVKVFADAFHSVTKNEILYDKFVWGTNVNAPADVVRDGVTAGAAWERRKVAGASVACTWVKSEFDGGPYDGRDVPMAPKATVAASGRVWIMDDLFVFGGWRFLSARRAFSDFANQGSRVASAGVFHLGAKYEPEAGMLAGMRFGIVVDNLLDRRYADAAVRSQAGEEVFYPAAGRSVMFTVGWDF